MSIKYLSASSSLSALCLCIFSALLLSACGGGGSSENSSDNTVDQPNTPSNPSNPNTPTDGTPGLTLSGPNPQFLALGAAFIDQGASASDATDGDLSSAITESNDVNTAVAGCYQQTYVVSNSASNSKMLTRTILVGTEAERHSPNTDPVTQEVAITNSFDSISIINLLDGVTDAECDVLTISNVSDPAVGTAKINSNGTVTYDPQGNVGSHFFTYTISDAYGGSNTSGVSIASVDPDDGNDNWPQITGENIITAKNTSIVIDVLANDFDLDGDELVLDVVDTPQHGTVQKQNGKVLYTPDLNYTGADFFYYGVHDDHGHNGSGLTEITITE